jgi:hypothetical protein
MTTTTTTTTTTMTMHASSLAVDGRTENAGLRKREEEKEHTSQENAVSYRAGCYGWTHH